eukprot:scaffold394_cov166-Amphora_coffeaeformis.AAC.11
MDGLPVLDRFLPKSHLSVLITHCRFLPSISITVFLKADWLRRRVNHQGPPLSVRFVSGSITEGSG